jgi:hypothetical protein
MTHATDSVATRFCYIYEEKYDYIYDENEDPNVSLLQKHMVLEFCFFESGAEFKKHTRCLVSDDGIFPRPDATMYDWEDRGADGRYPCAIQTPNASKMLPGNFAYKDIWIPSGGDLIGHPGADLTFRNMPHHLQSWEGYNETRDFYETLEYAEIAMKDAAEKLRLSPLEQLFADNHPIVSDNFEKWWQEWKTHWSNYEAESAKEASVISQTDKLSKKLLADKLQNSDVEKKIMADVYEKRFDRIRQYQQKIRNTVFHQSFDHLFGGNKSGSVQDAKEWAIAGLKADAKTNIIPRITGGLPSDLPFPVTRGLPYIQAKTAAQIFVEKFASCNQAVRSVLNKNLSSKKVLVQRISSDVDENRVSEIQKLFDDEECNNQNYRAWEVLCHFFPPDIKQAMYHLLHGKIDDHADYLLHSQIDEDVDDLLGRRPSSPVHHTTEHSLGELHTTRLQNPYILSS